MNKEQSILRIEENLVKFRTGSLILPRSIENFSLIDRMSQAHVPGMSLSVINGSKTEWSKGYGLLRNGTDRLVGSDSIFQACSVSKMVTSALVLHFVQERVFDLDKDINTYLTSWKVPENELTNERKVTLRRLLSHQAGINRPDGGFEWDENNAPTLINILNGQYPALVQAAQVEFVPGRKWQYSNMGYLIIQLVLEDILQKPFSRLIQDILFTPIAMLNSTFDYPLNPAWADREISLHDEHGNPTYPGLIPGGVAHGGLMTTSIDLAKFGCALINAYHGQTTGVITPMLVGEMLKQQIWVDDLSSLGFPFGQGLGVFLVEDGSKTIAFHPGGNDPGASCLVCLLPEKGQGAVIMTNGLQGITLSIEILSGIAHEYKWLL